MNKDDLEKKTIELDIVDVLDLGAGVTSLLDDLSVCNPSHNRLIELIVKLRKFKETFNYDFNDLVDGFL